MQALRFTDMRVRHTGQRHKWDGLAQRVSAQIGTACFRACALIVLVGCSESGGVAVEESIAGDTVVTIARGEAPLVRSSPVRVLWQSDSLERPFEIGLAHDRLVIADWTSLHVIDLTTGQARTIGRRGQGPGEFVQVIGPGETLGDSILGFDVPLQRLSLFDTAGTFVASWRLAVPPGFAAPSRMATQFIPHAGGVLSIREGELRQPDPVRVALVWNDLEGDSVRILARWDDLTLLEDGPRTLRTTELFPPRAYVRVSRDARVAYGDGKVYCISVRSVEKKALATGVRRYCRAWENVPVGKAIRNPDMSVIKDPEERRRVAQTLAKMPVSERLPAFDQILFDGDGRLWVRTLGPEMANVHPFLAAAAGSTPEFRKWDVLSRSGRLLATVEIPEALRLRLILGRRGVGFHSLPTGEVTLAEVTLPSIGSW